VLRAVDSEPVLAGLVALDQGAGDELALEAHLAADVLVGGAHDLVDLHRVDGAAVDAEQNETDDARDHRQQGDEEAEALLLGAAGAGRGGDGAGDAREVRVRGRVRFRVGQGLGQLVVELGGAGVGHRGPG
jgi:hypothetical protein